MPKTVIDGLKPVYVDEKNGVNKAGILNDLSMTCRSLSIKSALFGRLVSES